MDLLEKPRDLLRPAAHVHVLYLLKQQQQQQQQQQDSLQARTHLVITIL